MSGLRDTLLTRVSQQDKKISALRYKLKWVNWRVSFTLTSLVILWIVVVYLSYQLNTHTHEHTHKVGNGVYLLGVRG